MWLFYGFFLSFLFYYRCLPRCTRLPPFAAPNSFTTSTPFLPLSSHISNSITSRLTMIYEDNIVKQTQRQSWKRITGKKETSTNIILVAWWKKWNPFCGWLNWLVWYCFMGVNWMQFFFSFRPDSLCMATNQTFDDGKYLPKMLYTLICSHSATHMNRYISHHFWQMCDLIAIAGRREKNMLTAGIRSKFVIFCMPRAIWECEENHF